MTLYERFLAAFGFVAAAAAGTAAAQTGGPPISDVSTIVFTHRPCTFVWRRVSMVNQPRSRRSVDASAICPPIRTSVQQGWRPYSRCCTAHRRALSGRIILRVCRSNLFLTACEQAERSETAVRAAALMHIARVMARSDQVAAEQLLERGIALAERIEGDAPSLLLRNAISLAAAVSAKHAPSPYAEHRRVDPFGGAVVGLVNVMAQHGRLNDAICVPPRPVAGRPFSPYILSTILSGNATMMRPGGNSWNWPSGSGENPLPAKQVPKKNLLLRR
jgi:hypothetical protein